MKVFGILFVLVLAIFQFSNAAVTYKNSVCAEDSKADGNGYISCAAFIQSWSYNPQSNACEQFVYGGCGGNGNRFGTEEKCKTTCVV